MVANPGLGQIPLIPSTDPSQWTTTYNNLINQLNSQVLSGVATIGGQFSTTTLAGINAAQQLTPATFAAQILILVELRIHTNLLAMNRGAGVGDLAQTRAEELNNILPGATL